MNIDTVMDVPALCAVIKEKYDLFSTRKVLYDRWYQCFLEKDTAERDLKSKMSVVLLAAGIIGLLDFVPAGVMILGTAAQSSVTQSQMSGKNIMTFAAAGLVIAVLGAMLLLLWYKKRKSKLHKKITQCQEEMKNITMQLADYYHSLSDPLIPLSHSSPYTLWELYEIARKKRAYSISDALKVYDADVRQKLSIIRKKKEVEGREKRALAEAGFAMYILSRPVDIDVYMH